MVSNTGITIFNKVTDTKTRNEKLFKTLIPSALFIEKESTVKSVSAVGMDSSDDVKIYITNASIKGATKCFKRSKDVSDINTQFTIQRGSIIVRGHIYHDVESVAELEKNMDSVYVVTTVIYHDYGSENFRHIEIGAR